MSDRPFDDRPTWQKNRETIEQRTAETAAAKGFTPPPPVMPVEVTSIRIPMDQVFALVFKVLVALVILSILPFVAVLLIGALLR